MPYRKLIIPLGVVVLSILTAGILRATKQEALINPDQERTWSVDTVLAQIVDIRPSVHLFGEVIAGRDANLRSLAAGEVIYLSSNFIEGGRVQKGERLLEINPFIPRRKLLEREALVIQARARYDELVNTKTSDQLILHEELRQLDIRENDLARYERLEGGVVSEQTLDEKRLAASRAKHVVLLRQQRLSVLNAQIEQQQAVIDRQKASRERAEEDLRATIMEAPFDGYIADIKVAQGTHLNTGDFVARLIDSNWLEVRIFLSNAQFGRMFKDTSGFPSSKVKWKMGETEFNFDATIERMESLIESSTGGVHVYAPLEKDISQSLLRPGAIVDVFIEDRLYKDVVNLPEEVLYNEDTAYVLAEGRLQERSVVLIARDGNNILLRGELSDGDLVVSTRFDGIGDGVAARSEN